MIQDILKSLSDTEITAIAKELDNPMISNTTILGQLMGKIGGPGPIDPNQQIEIEKESSMIMKDPEILPIKLALELANRLLERDQES